VSWQRALVAAALADTLKTAQGSDDTAGIFSQPPETLNAPALVVGRPTEVLYGVAGLGMDQATIPVICIGPSTGDDIVDGLIHFVREAVRADVTLSGAVPSCICTSERNWRPVRIAGADLLAADVVLTIQT
jgi:hypothetical protein